MAQMMAGMTWFHGVPQHIWSQVLFPHVLWSEQRGRTLTDCVELSQVIPIVLVSVTCWSFSAASTVVWKKLKKCAMLKLLTVGSYGRKPPWMFYGLVFENRQSRLVLYIDCWTLATPYTSFLPVKVTGVDCRYAPLRGSGSPSSEPLPTAFTKAKNSLDTLQSGTDKPQYETCPVGM